MARFRSLGVAGLIAVTVCAASGGAQQQPAAPQPAADQQAAPADQQPPAFRGGINFVRVDVIATSRDGTAVADLQQQDFEVLEDGKPQKIETFKFVELDGGLMQAADAPARQIRTDADEQAEASRDDVRLFAFFLDDYHVRRESSMASRREISRFIETQLGPTDMVAIMYPLQPVASVRFTRNHEAIRKGIEQFSGRMFEYEPKNMYEEQYAYYPTEIVERVRNQVSLSALESLVSHMGGLKEGRKTLILVSEGYSNMLPPQLRNPVAAYGGVGNPTRNDPNAGQNDPNEFRAQAFASFDMQEELRQVYQAANRHNVSIYGVDPRGLATSEFSIAENINSRTDRDYLMSTMDTLRMMSEQTDGRAIVNRNDLTLAMKQIVLDASAYYLIGYSSATAPTDGKFHEIRVRIRRPGVQVRARRGYWAITTADLERITATAATPSLPKPIETALATLAYPARLRVIRTWIGTERGESGMTRVTFVWEPASRGAAGAAARGGQPARVSVTAVGPDGSPYYRGRVPADSPASAATSAAAPPPAGARVSFEAPPGPIQLRLSVEGADSEVLDAETRELVVPDLTAADVIFGTPGIFRGRTVRDMQQLRTNREALPTATREFQRTDRLLIRVPVYGPDGSRPAVAAKILNRTGQPISDLTVAADGADAVVDMPLASLPTGDYVLEISAGGSGVKELVAFRITS
jgi:VWFA-related protein